MKNLFYFYNVLILVLTCLFFTSSSVINDRPIIGIVTEEVNTSFAPNASSYIMASYVKYLESSGARVVPIMIYKPRQYYKDLMSKINGVLFPGGGTPLNGTGYGRTGKIIFDIAVEMNNKGDFFPLWGTCLGFELLNFLVAKKSWMMSCDAQDVATNINFVEGFESSKLFSDLDTPLKSIMMNQNISINYHRWCFTPANYTASHLNEYFKVLATDQDSKGVTFISIIEAYKYPFYGVAFHPEKVLFEWVLSETHQHIPHSAEAVQVSQYFGRFFANEARKSSHHFPSKEEEDAALIYNYNPVFTGKKKNYASMQNYYFN